MRLLNNVVRATVPEHFRRSLDASWKEGVVAQVMISIFDYYLIPYALFLGANNQMVGLLVALPNLMASLTQFIAVRGVEIAGTRRNVLIRGIGLQAILLMPVVLLGVIPLPGKIPILIVLITIYRVLGSFIGPAWGSLVSDYLPEGQRGQYFGWRQRMVSIAGIAGISFWGSLLYLLKFISQGFAFAVLFSAAVIFRFISFYFVRKMADVPVHPAPGADFTFWMFIRRFRESNFVKFILYATGITFAIQLASPYFSVHLLKNLHFNYLSYMAVNLASVVAGIAAFPLWGRNADIVGNAKVLKSTSFMIPLVPLMWMFARNVYELVLIEMFSGFVFSGFSLAASNFIYDAVSPAKRVRCLGYYNVINGGAIFLGATLGGYLSDKLPPIFGFSIITLFLLSAICRFLADLFLSPHFREVRAETTPASSMQLYLSVAGIRPLIGENTEPETYPDLRPERDKYDKTS
jgi:MFS family permease